MTVNREQGTRNREQREAAPAGEQGFMLVGLIVAMAIILLFLGIAASKTAFALRREREVESARRADQYVRAIRRYYLKNGSYPGSIDLLDKGIGIHYLRQRYVDPLTGKADYRLIPVGQNKTTVKGFFGEPLAGIAGQGLGAAAGMQSSGVGGPTTVGGSPGAGGIGGGGGIGGFGGVGGAPGAGTNGAAGQNGSSGFGGVGSIGSSGATDQSGATGAAGNNSGLGSAAGMASSGFGSSGSSGPFMGVGSSAKGNSILVVNEQTTYDSWEFLYDPRVEKLKAAAALNAGVGSAGAGQMGTTPGAFGSTPGGFGQTPGAFGSNGTPGGGSTPGGATTGGSSGPGGTTPPGP